MIDQIHDSPPRRSSPSRDENESSKIKRRDVSSRSPIQIDEVSRGFEIRRTDREQDVDGIRRDCVHSAPYEVDTQIRDGFYIKDRRDAFSGEHYPNRSDSSETVLGGLMRSTMKQCMSDEPETFRFITSSDYNKYPPSQNVLRNDETVRLESNFNDSSRLRLNGEDAREKDTLSPLSQVGSSGADLQDESSSRIVSLSSKRCCVRVNESQRVDERGVYYSENRCASQVLQSRHFDGYVGGNSSTDQQGKHNVNNMADLLVQRRGYGSNMVDVDVADTHLEFYSKERMTDQYDSMKEHYPYVELGSSGVNERDDKAQHYRNVGYEERKVFSLDSKCQLLLRKDYHYDGVDGRMHLDFSRQDVVVRDDNAPQSITLCLNKEREAYLDNERKVVYSENRRRELRNEYFFRNDGHGEDIVVDRDGRVVQLLRVCLNKGSAAYLDNEREDVYLQHKSQQLKKDYYDSGTDARIYPDVDWEDARGLRHRGVFLNDRKEAYLLCESQQFVKDHETDSYAMMHPDIYKSDTPVDLEDARGLKYRKVLLNDRKEAYLQCESHQLVKDHEADPYAMMHPDVNKSNILIDTRALKLRQASLDDGKESYLDNERGYAYRGYENQQVKNDYEYGIDGMIHPYVNMMVDQEDARALELRGVSYHDGNESYLDNEKGAAYLRYESQQLRKEHGYDIDDRIYRDVNMLDITGHHEDARLLERRGASFDNDNEAYLDNERGNAYMHYKIQQWKKDHDSGIDARMYPDVNRSEIVTDQEAARALERRGVSLNDGRKAYMHYENNQLLKHHEIDAYEMMHHDVRRSSAGKQDEEALRCRRYPFDDPNQVYLDDERLPLRNDGHAKVHANRRYPDGRQKVYHSSEYSFKDEAGEVIHENIADGYNNYSEVKQSGMSYEKAYSGRLRDHEVAYDREKQVCYAAVEGGTRTEQSRYLVDERSLRNDDHTSSLCRPHPRIPAKERLGGRVGDSRVDVKYRVMHQVRNPKRKGKSYNRNQKNIV